MGKTKVKVVLNSNSVQSLLKSQAMQSICLERANKALASLGGGYEVSSMIGRTRCNAEVAAVSYKARKENGKNNTILKAIK